MQMYFIRHGAVPGNLEGRYVGDTDEALVEDARAAIAEDRDRYPLPDLLFVSPLLRCRETAALLFPQLPQHILPGLRECSFGEFEYRNYQELQTDARYQAFIDSGGTIAFPGGEAPEDFIARCREAFLEAWQICLDRGAERPAFVVHGGTIMAILSGFCRPQRPYFDWQVKNLQGFCCTEENVHSPVLTDPLPLPLPAQTGVEELFVMKQQKKLQCGYTTGSCAAAAAKAAAYGLLTGRISKRSSILTPKGIRLHLPIEEPSLTETYAQAAVRKNGGDDPDATHGTLIFARAEYLPELTQSPGSLQEENAEPASIENKLENNEEIFPENIAFQEGRIVLDGGIGVGRVTRAGLEQAIGAPAINRVPREMICREVLQVCGEAGYEGRLKITISVPEGEQIAAKTFNPHLGIRGGISILGTSGIVVPMSEEALIASIRLEMQQKLHSGEEYLLITPGNYGADFIRRKELSRDLDAESSMKCSNYVGETLDMAVEMGAKGILFIAHIGKFVKVSGGIMNTHSASADCRAELMTAAALRAGASRELADRLLASNTTEEALEILNAEHFIDETIRELLPRIQFHLQKRVRGAIKTEVILFSNQQGYLGETPGADSLMQQVIAQKRLQTAEEGGYSRE